MSLATEVVDINRVAKFLARRDVPGIDAEAIRGANGGESADAIVVCGCDLPAVAHVAAATFMAGAASIILVSGGIGHSAERLRIMVEYEPGCEGIRVEDRTEADILRDVLVHCDHVPPGSVFVENRSTNGGENALFSKRALAKAGMNVRSLVLIQDPTMQRRSHAAFERAWEGEGVRILSFAPFVPEACIREGALALVDDNHWMITRFMSLLMGEIPRLRDDANGYGPNGRNFIGHVEIPEDVLKAHERLSAAVYRGIARK